MRIEYRGPPTGAGQGAALRTVPKCELIKPAAAARAANVHECEGTGPGAAARAACRFGSNMGRPC